MFKIFLKTLFILLIAVFLPLVILHNWSIFTDDINSYYMCGFLVGFWTTKVSSSFFSKSN